MSGHAATGKGKAKKHKGHEEEHENHERWLVSYADMLTLLFVLFVVLYAISSVNQQKFDALKDGMAKGFGSPVGGLNGSTGALSDPGINAQAIDVSAAQAAAGPSKGTGMPTKAQVESAAKDLLARRKIAEESVKAQQLDKLKAQLDAELTKRGLKNTVNTRITARGVVITVLADNVTFARNSATLQPGGKRILDGLVPVLASVGNSVSVEGNTDTTRSAPKGWDSEFGLSSARAVGVVDYLSKVKGIPVDRLSSTGRGLTNPLVPGTSVKANKLNRRVEIIVLAEETAPDVSDSLTEAEADELTAATDAEVAAQAAAEAKAKANAEASHLTTH